MKYLLIVLIILSFSCKKEYSCENCDPPGPVEEPNYATVIDGGPLAGDGCDWMLMVGTEFYHPDSLPDAFKENDLNVIVEYELTNQLFICGLRANNGLPIIHLISIKR